MITEKYFDQFPQLESERLILRQLTLADAAELQTIRSDERVMVYMDSDRHSTIAHSQKFITENMDMYKQRKGLFWAIIEKSSGNFLGDFSYWQIDKKNSRVEIGYTLKPEYWGKGFMKEAMIKILNFGFNELNLHSIEANINSKNDNSRTILTRLGFVKEAYHRENYYYDGKYLDSEIYSLLKTGFKYTH